MFAYVGFFLYLCGAFCCMIKDRLSNIEVLRIIAISMVVMLHFNAHCLHPGLLLSRSTELSWLTIEGNLIESLCIAAVNVFVLISGYFSIKLSVRSVLNLYIRCLIIGLITYLAYVLISGEAIGLSVLAGRLLAFTHNKWWFVISYLGLMAISPILNAGCEKMEKKTFLYVVLLFSIVIMYFGWWRYQEQTYGGYSLIHFIYLYILARYIRLHISNDFISRYRWLWLCLFFFICIGLTLMPFLISHAIYVYDNPLVIASAVCILLFFLSIPFQNRFINTAAASVFSAYLIQESPFFGHKWLYPYCGDLIANTSHGGGAMLFVVFTIATVVVAIIIDRICVMPVIRWANILIEKYTCKK